MKWHLDDLDKMGTYEFCEALDEVYSYEEAYKKLSRIERNERYEDCLKALKIAEESWTHVIFERYNREKAYLITKVAFLSAGDRPCRY